MSIKTFVLLKTMLDHSPPMLMIVSIKLEKSRYVIFLEFWPAEGQPFIIYIKLWRQVCLLTPHKLSVVSSGSWNVFYVPKFAPCQLLLKLSGLWSIDSEIGLRKLLFDKMAPVARNLFQIRSQSYFDANIVSLGVLPSISEALHKYGLFSYFDS